MGADRKEPNLYRVLVTGLIDETVTKGFANYLNTETLRASGLTVTIEKKLPMDNQPGTPVWTEIAYHG